MKKLLFMMIFAIPITCAFGESFDEFKKAQLAEAEKYSNDLYKDFEAYKQLATEEMEKFTGKVKTNWGDGLVSSDKIWVEYSPDMNTRRIVNFETGEITIQIKDNSSKADKATLEKEVQKLVTETSAQAFKSDNVSVNIESRLKSEGIKAESALLPETPVLAEIANDAVALAKNSTISTEELTNGVKALTLKTTVKMDYAPEKTPVLSANGNIGTIHKKAKSFQGAIHKYASERKMPPALVFAITHNESSFNPMAKSHVPAYGMMQLVPISGGKEASAVIFGKPTVLAPSYLYNPENNIRLGAIYLSQLYYNYFKDISNFEARLYCTVSAYNTGPGNVARAFTGNRNLAKAIPVINAMTAEEVYGKLLTSLPYEETRKYLAKVTSSYNAYSGF